VIEFQVGTGETISQDAVVALIHGSVDGTLDDEILGALEVGRERTFEQDPTLALRILADIALRSLSPAINDPTLAVQALDGIDALLRRLATRTLKVGRIRPEGNAARPARLADVGRLPRRQPGRDHRSERSIAQRSQASEATAPGVALGRSGSSPSSGSGTTGPGSWGQDATGECLGTEVATTQ
jgi:hypothetical protein